MLLDGAARSDLGGTVVVAKPSLFCGAYNDCYAGIRGFKGYRQADFPSKN